MSTSVPVQWSAKGAVINAFSGAALQNCAAAAIVTSAVEVDNSGGDQYGEVVLLWNPVSTPEAGGNISVWWLEAVDGTNYETLHGATLIPQRRPDLVFPIGSEAGSAHDAQRIVLRSTLPPCKFKAVLQNNTSVASENTSGASLLDIYPVNDTLVVP
jgi:hypothetical protein